MLRLVSVLSLLLGLGAPVGAADWHVAPDGREAGQGTAEAPWDIGSALDGDQEVEPGDTIWIAPGRYHARPEVGSMGYEVRLAGNADAPIRVRGVPGERVTIDGGLNVQPPSTYLEIRDLEITVSEPRPEKPIPPDPSYRNVNRPWGGLNVYSGAGCKFINLVIHDNSQGVSWWTGSTDSELYGCIIYDNGWAGTDRGHGHAIYTQNRDGTKTIADCIMTGGYGYTLHAYGSERAYVDNYHVEGNIACNGGTFLVGGGRPSHGIRVVDNVLYRVSMQLGYSAPFNEDCVVRDNLIVRGGLTIKEFRRVEDEGNVILDAREAANLPDVRSILRPNKYDPDRAHLAVVAAEDRDEVEVDLGAFLKPGDAYRLIDPRDFYGDAVRTGTADGRPVRVPLQDGFAAFILFRVR